MRLRTCVCRSSPLLSSATFAGGVLYVISYCCLFYFVLFCSVLFCSILFYSILSYCILFYPILFYSILLYPIVSYSILSYSILSYSAACIMLSVKYCSPLTFCSSVFEFTLARATCPQLCVGTGHDVVGSRPRESLSPARSTQGSPK